MRLSALLSVLRRLLPSAPVIPPLSVRSDQMLFWLVRHLTWAFAHVPPTLALSSPPDPRPLAHRLGVLYVSCGIQDGTAPPHNQYLPLHRML